MNMRNNDNEKEKIYINNNQLIYNTHKKDKGKDLHIYIKYITIAFFFLIIISLIFIFKLYKIDINIDKHRNLNHFKYKYSYNYSIINEPISPDNDNEIPRKKYFKTNYDTTNIRYHFEDLFLKRKLFLINYSFFPYKNINKSKSYDENADFIYESTGMLNMTLFDMFYNGTNRKDYLDFNHIHLSMGHDANYILLSLVSVASILNTTNSDTFIHFHFILLDSKFKDMKPIIALKKIYNNVEFIFYNGKQAEYDFSSYKDGMNRGIGDYTKFLIPQIVNNTNRVIILDSADIIAKKDLSEVYFFDLGENYFGFALDISAGRYSKFFIFARNKFYANIGITLVNVAQFKKDNLYMSGYFARLAYSNMPCPTQEMFFMISRYKFKYFPLIYNSPQFFNDDNEQNGNKKKYSLINDYLELQKYSPFKYTKDEIFHAQSNEVVSHLFTTKILKNQANKKNGKIWINYVKLANIYDILKAKYPSTFKYYEE